MSVGFGNRRVAALLGLATLALASGASAADEAKRLGHAPASANADFDLYLPLRNTPRLDRLLSDLQDPASPSYHKFLTPNQFAAQFGPDDATIARVRSALTSHGMSVTGQTTQSLHVHASAAAVEAAFATHLSNGRFADGNEELVADAPLSLPAELEGYGARIPQFAATHLRRKHMAVVEATPQSSKGPTGPYTTADLRQAYDFPDLTALNGHGVTIGILMQGAYNAPDINAFFTKQGLTPPSLSTVNINGGFAYNVNDSIETHLDIQQSAGMAPGAAVVLYNVKSLDDANLQAGLTRINTDNRVDIVNMSFGEPEVAFQPRFNGGVDARPQMQTYAALFAQGVAQGITFVASSGDDGSNPVITTSPVLSVSHPASDPNVTAVGGTNLVTVHDAADTSSAYVGENASDDPYSAASGGAWGSGGGVSITFAQPSYQAPIVKKITKFRVVPDVALHMGGCPSTAKQPCGANRSADYVVIGGHAVGVIGTSASAPDFAGLLALKVALARGAAAAPAGRLGNANPDIYAKLAAQIAGGAPVYRHSVIVGNNGSYSAKAPFDAVIGAGTVDARQFLGVTNLPAAGNPGTAGNP
jgi:subtilase family serine protease